MPVDTELGGTGIAAGVVIEQTAFNGVRNSSCVNNLSTHDHLFRWWDVCVAKAISEFSNGTRDELAAHSATGK
jgi:hypothetical protein